MKILYHHRIASKDGQYVHLEELVAALRRAGHEVILVGPTVVDASDFGSEGGFIHSLRKALPQFVYEILEFAYSGVAWWRLRRAAMRHRPDVIYERYNLFFPAGIWVSKQLRIPLILEVNAPLYEERMKYGGISLDGLAHWSQNYAWRNADVVLPVTSVLAGMVAASGAESDAIAVVHNGVVLERYDGLPERDAVKKRFGIDGSVTLGFVGFIREWHRLDIVIEALRDQALADASLLVIGDGPAREALQEQAQRAGLNDRVVFTGLVQRTDLIETMAAFDVALQPHVVSYASPLKLFEYMAMSLPVIAPDTPNIREVLTHGEDSLLVPAGDQQSMHDALVRLVRNDDLRVRLGRGARLRIESGCFTWDNNARRVAEIATRLKSGHPGGAE